MPIHLIANILHNDVILIVSLYLLEILKNLPLRRIVINMILWEPLHLPRIELTAVI